MYQTLNPKFFEITLEKSLSNLGIETLDIHYIHIPEITRAGLSEEAFYNRMEELFQWYEIKVHERKIRNYGIALEFMAEEPKEDKWHFETESWHKSVWLLSKVLQKSPHKQFLSNGAQHIGDNCNQRSR